MMNDGKQQSTFLFHDYETFGTHPALDRPAQFAAIRTDNEFNVIGEPEVFYCKPADDYLPQPGAVFWATTMCVSTTKSHATFFIVISTILTPGAGSMITRAGICWMLCVPVMPCARKE
ncbi:exonuclease I [Shigella sonnei]|nr:exonuclease I [Shigella sonnei]